MAKKPQTNKQLIWKIYYYLLIFTDTEPENNQQFIIV